MTRSTEARQPESTDWVNRLRALYHFIEENCHERVFEPLKRPSKNAIEAESRVEKRDRLPCHVKRRDRKLQSQHAAEHPAGETAEVVEATCYVPSRHVPRFTRLCAAALDSMQAVGLAPPLRGEKKSAAPQHIAYKHVERLHAQNGNPEWFPDKAAMLYKAPDEYQQIFDAAIGLRPALGVKKRGRPPVDVARHNRIISAWFTEQRSFRRYEDCARELGSGYTVADVKRAVNREAQRRRSKKLSSPSE